MRILLDLHCSDSWADPGQQSPPAARAALSFPVLAESVRAYRERGLAAFITAELHPMAVQIGNEITHGFLGPYGKVGGRCDTPDPWRRFATLGVIAREKQQ